MTFEKVIKMLEKEYEFAKKQGWIKNLSPMLCMRFGNEWMQKRVSIVLCFVSIVSILCSRICMANVTRN